MRICLRYFGAALLLAAFAIAPARADWMEWSWGGGNGPYWETPEENVILSARYDWLLETHPGFRHYRMAKECGPIDFSAALKDDCLGTFDQYEPARGWDEDRW
jgi:hypothetical protein